MLQWEGCCANAEAPAGWSIQWDSLLLLMTVLNVRCLPCMEAEFIMVQHLYFPCTVKLMSIKALIGFASIASHRSMSAKSWPLAVLSTKTCQVCFFYLSLSTWVLSSRYWGISQPTQRLHISPSCLIHLFLSTPFNGLIWLLQNNRVKLWTLPGIIICFYWINTARESGRQLVENGQCVDK